MAKKVFKILFIILILFSFCMSYIYATDIDFNLQNPETNNVENTNNTDGSNNVADENAVPDENIETPNNDDTTADTLHPSEISTSPESGLSISNIINILLITVGIIIILLGIAIIIRLKK